MEQPSREPEFLESAARLRMLSRLAGALAHECRNPLTTIFLHAAIREDALRRLEDNQRPQLLHLRCAVHLVQARQYASPFQRVLVLKRHEVCVP
jgi:hypothetical protein